MARLEKGVNDLATTHPELAKEADGWDSSSVSAGSKQKKTWLCEKGHHFTAVVCDRKRGRGCPYCSGRKAVKGVNDLATTHPELAKEADGWDTTEVSAGSHRELAWKCSLGHAWSASVVNRSKGRGCPYCSGQRVLSGFNDLATHFPELAKEADGWDPSKVSKKSGEKLPWKCSEGHTWLAAVDNRSDKGTGCPYCSGHLVVAGKTDLATTHPEVAKEADGWDPRQVTTHAGEKLPWRCGLGHTWKAFVYSRTSGQNCPFCSGRRLLKGFNDLATTHPQLAREADGWDPSTVSRGTLQKLGWKCAKGHSWQATVANRTAEQNTGCPECAASGYKTSLAGWFYLLQRPGEQQLGVTNELEVRLRTHARRGWTQVEVVGPANGKEVLETEKRLKRWLRRKVGLVPGTRENWFTSKLEVRSLAELKAKSGVETELF